MKTNEIGDLFVGNIQTLKLVDFGADIKAFILGELMENEFLLIDRIPGGSCLYNEVFFHKELGILLTLKNTVSHYSPNSYAFLNWKPNLKYGGNFKDCWYLKMTIENDSPHFIEKLGLVTRMIFRPGRFSETIAFLKDYGTCIKPWITSEQFPLDNTILENRIELCKKSSELAECAKILLNCG